MNTDRASRRPHLNIDLDGVYRERVDGTGLDPLLGLEGLPIKKLEVTIRLDSGVAVSCAVISSEDVPVKTSGLVRALMCLKQAYE